MRTQPDYYYNQSAVIPFRFHCDALEVLLITSRRRRRWIIPKGIIEQDLTPIESAQKEAWEEAGVEGIVRGKSLGIYVNEKWGGVCQVAVYAMKVNTIHDVWPEDDRTREWVDVETAAERVREPELTSMLLDMPTVVRKNF
jgi:phosphohistidine phosphatase